MSDIRDRKARSVADLTQGTILATVDIAAPPERVFRAISSREVTEWWGSADSYRTTAYHADLVPGGAWRSEGVGADGRAFSVGGELLEIDPPRKLVHTWKPEWDGGHSTRVTYRLEPIDGGTRLTLWHDGFAGRPDACANHGQGWERVLDWLRVYAGPKTAPPRYFVCRLLPPRPTFALDMNEQERATMQAHAGYWRELLQRGTAVVFGPVADPAGSWGLGVLRVQDEAELQRLTSQDPAIVAQLGLRYELLPMFTAVHA